MKNLRLATRGSPLALAQTQLVAERLQRRVGSVTPEIVVVPTQADRSPDKPLRSFGDKGVFIREVQRAVADGRADAAVHSLKDLPAEPTEGFVLAAILPREEPCDVLVCRGELTVTALESLPVGARVGTASLRRRGQLLHLRPDLQMVDMRGNVDTRLRKLARGEFDALVLAKAGLVRLGLRPPQTLDLPYEVVLPAACQGAIGVETLADSPAARLLAAIDDPATRTACEAERLFVRTLGADCHTPVACYCDIRAGEAIFRGLVCSLDGRQLLRCASCGAATEACQLAERTALDLLQRGAQQLMQEARQLLKGAEG